MITGPLFSGALFALVLSTLLARRSPKLWLGLTLSGLLLTLLSSLFVLGGAPSWEWRSTFAFAGAPLHLLIDPLSALFLVLVSVVGSAGAVYSTQYWSAAEHPKSCATSRLAWSATLLSMLLLLSSANGLHFLISWELFALGAYFLITLDNRHPAVRKAGWLYLGASHAGTLCLFAFFTLLQTHTNTWDLGPLRDHAELAPLFWFALLGFGIKAGLFPLHIWLPSAHANAPSHVSALMSGVCIKMGVYGLLRFTGWLPIPTIAPWLLLSLGALSALFGIAFALAQSDLKRLLAYCSVENIGVIFIGLGAALLSANKMASVSFGLLALCGALLHIWNHGLFKALLFFCSGSVLHATHTRDINRLGGLWQGMPWTAAFFAVGSLSVTALPPFNGFISEWLIYLGLLESVTSPTRAVLAALPALLLMAMAGALAVATFAKAAGLVFLGAPRTAQAAKAHECGPWMRAPMLALSVLCFLLGLAPFLLWPVLKRVAFTWNPAWLEGASTPALLDRLEVPSLKILAATQLGLALLLTLACWFIWRKTHRNGVRRAPTWDCGYAAPNARMQYTAASFSDTVSPWFKWLLKPQDEWHKPRGILPSSSRRLSVIPETVLVFVVTPLARLIMRLSAAVRRRQHGHLQSYILYLLAGLLALALLTLVGGSV